MKRILVLLALVGYSALGQISPPPNPGGGGSGSVTSVGATGTGLFNLTVTNPTTTPLIVPTLNTQAPGTVYGNFTTGTSVASFGAFPVSMLANSGQVSPISSGLVGEYHLNEGSGATVGIDYSGQGNNGAYFGTPTLTGTLSGGMVSAGAGGMDYPTSFNTGASQATTLSTYVCSNALSTTSASYALLIGGLNSATVPSTSNLQSFGLMMNQNNLATLPGFAGKYGTNPSVFNGATVPTVSSQSTDGCHLITWVRGSSTDKLFIDANEVTQYQFQTAGTLAVTPSSGSISLGMPHFATLPNASFAYPFSIYFNFVYNRALTSAEVSTLSGSAQSYAQFRGIVKAPTVFSDAGNQLLFVGDSITFGINGTPWVRLISTTTPYIAITGVAGLTNNIATPSWTLANMIQECESRGYGAMNPNSATTVVIWGATNDLVLGGVTPAVAYQRLRRLVQCYKRRAPRVIVTTMLSRGLNGVVSAPDDLLKNQINDLIRKDNAGADGTWDIASFVGFGADGASINPTLVCAGATACFGADSIHPSTTGETTVAALFSNYINWMDSVKNSQNPKLTTSTSYTEVSDDVAINANPTGGSQTITLPDAQGLVGTDRYVFNIQATGANTVTLTAISGQNIDGSSTLICPNATKCNVRAVLGTTLGTGTADATSGAHWEQFGFSSSGGGGTGNATSIQGVAVTATAPTVTNNVLIYNGSSYAPGVVSGTTVPQMTSTVQGIANCDGTTITCTSGILSAVGGGSVSSVFTRTGAVVATTGDYTVAQVTGAAPLASPTFTGTVIASTMNATTYQKGGGGVRFMNTCANITTTTALTYTCSITGGATTNPCFAGPMNAAAALLWSGTASITTPLAPNIPFAAIASGTTLTITFTSGANIQPVVAGALFSAGCSI